MVTKIRAADAKEVGVGNPAEETCCYPNNVNCIAEAWFVNGTFDFANEMCFALRARYWTRF